MTLATCVGANSRRQLDDHAAGCKLQVQRSLRVELAPVRRLGGREHLGHGPRPWVHPRRRRRVVRGGDQRGQERGACGHRPLLPGDMCRRETRSDKLPRRLARRLRAGLKGSRVRFGKLRLRAILALLVLTTTVPLGLFAGLVICKSWQQQRALVERRNVETARAVMVAVDQDVESVRARCRRWPPRTCSIRPIARASTKWRCGWCRRKPGWYAVLLVHPSGAVMADTALPSGDTPSFTTADWVQTRQQVAPLDGVEPVSEKRRPASTFSSSPCR